MLPGREAKFMSSNFKDNSQNMWMSVFGCCRDVQSCFQRSCILLLFLHSVIFQERDFNFHNPFKVWFLNFIVNSIKHVCNTLLENIDSVRKNSFWQNTIPLIIINPTWLKGPTPKPVHPSPEYNTSHFIRLGCQPLVPGPIILSLYWLAKNIFN